MGLIGKDNIDKLSNNTSVETLKKLLEDELSKADSERDYYIINEIKQRIILYEKKVDGDKKDYKTDLRRPYLVFHYVITIMYLIVAALGMIYDNALSFLIFIIFLFFIGLRELVRIKTVGSIYKKKLTIIHGLLIWISIFQCMRLFYMGSPSRIVQYLFLLAALVAYTMFFIYFYEPFNKKEYTN